MNSKNHLLCITRSLCGVLLLTGSLCFAEESSDYTAANIQEIEQTADQIKEELTNLSIDPANYIEAGNRPLPHNEVIAIEKKRIAEYNLRTAQEEQQLSSEEASAVEKALAKGSPESIVASLAALNNRSAIRFPESSRAVAPFLTTHAGALHTVTERDVNGLFVVLEDGSCWTVRSNDAWYIKTWFPIDYIPSIPPPQLLIAPNHSWFSSYYFRLFNQATGESVAANLQLYLRPELQDPRVNRYVVGYDDLTMKIWLDDRTEWWVHGNDYSKKWAINDTVIIGINDYYDSFFDPYMNILIDCNILHYVRANCVK